MNFFSSQKKKSKKKNGAHGVPSVGLACCDHGDGVDDNWNWMRLGVYRR